MNGGGDEDFAVEELFASHLNEGGASLDNEHNADDGEEQESVGHHSDDAEASTEGEGASVAHHKASGRDVKPDVGEEPADYREAEAEEHPLTLKEGDDAIGAVSEHHEATGETVETVADIGGVARGYDGESEEDNHTDDADFYAADKGNHHGGPAELDGEEPTKDSTDDGNEKQLGASAETSGTFAAAKDVDEIVYEADGGATEKAGEREPSLTTVEIANKCDGGDDDNADDAGHSGEVTLELVCVKLGHNREGGAIGSGLFLLFPELVFVGKVGVNRGQKHGQEEGAERQDEAIKHFVSDFCLPHTVLFYNRSANF